MQEVTILELQIEQHQARLVAIDEQLPEVRNLVGEIQDKLNAHQRAVFEALKAQGSTIGISGLSGGGYFVSGIAHSRPVTIVYGGREETIGGAPKPGSTEAHLEHVLEVQSALEREMQFANGAMVSMERERMQIERNLGLGRMRLDELRGEDARSRVLTARQEALIGPSGRTWRQRLAAIVG